jgi:hypothetical protein
MATHGKPDIEIWWFYFFLNFPSLLATENLQNHSIFKSFIFNFASKKQAAMESGKKV